MTDYVIIGAEDPLRKDNKIYLFPYHSPIEDSSRDNSLVQSLEVIVGEGTRKTPRIIKSHGDLLHVMTNGHFLTFAAKENTFERIKFKKLQEMFNSVAEEDSFGKIVNNNNFRGSMIVDDKGTIFSSIYRSDRLKLDSSVFLGGYLFYANFGEVDNFKVLQNERGETFHPTGDLNLQKGVISCPSDNLLLRFKQEGKSFISLNPIKLEERLLSFNVNEDQILCSDIKEGYMLSSKGRELLMRKKEGFRYLLDNSSRKYLPSEASSVLLAKNHKQYALFGADNGKLLVYTLEEGKNGSDLQYLKTVSFLALNEHSGEKDNHVWGLQYKSGFISFTLRNLFIRVALDKLVNFTPDQRIDQTVQQFSSNMEYLQQMKETYQLDAIYSVPHRITCVDTWKVSK